MNFLLSPENRKTIPGSCEANSGRSVHGKRGECVQADDKVYNRNVDRRIRQGSGGTIKVLVSSKSGEMNKQKQKQEKKDSSWTLPQNRRKAT